VALQDLDPGVPISSGGAGLDLVLTSVAMHPGGVSARVSANGPAHDAARAQPGNSRSADDQGPPAGAGSAGAFGGHPFGVVAGLFGQLSWLLGRPSPSRSG